MVTVPDMRALHIDIETAGPDNLDRVGAYRYAYAATLLLFGYAYDDDPVRVLDILHGEPVPKTILDDLTSPEVIKYAHNAAFERALLSRLLNVYLDPRQWRCTAVHARSLNLPASLDQLATELKLPDGKLAEGKRLIRKFSLDTSGAFSPDASDPDWRLFIDYCRRDVEVEREIGRRLAAYPMPEHEWALWALDQDINDVGLPIDRALVARGCEHVERHLRAVAEQAAKRTRLDNPNSRQQFLGWLTERGVDAPDLTGKTVTKLLRSGDLDWEVQTALELRQQLASSSLAKWPTLREAACPDPLTRDHPRIRGAFQFNGASRTARWAGRIFQPHNLPRGSLKQDELDIARQAALGDLDTLGLLFGDVSGALSSLLRTAIAAPPGQQLVVADYASIETVMVAWAAESEYLLDLLRSGRDPYKDFAAKLFGCDYEGVTKAQRTLAKPAVLGGVYSLSGPGLMRYAEGFGLSMAEDEARRHIRVFRESYSDIPKFWGMVEGAALQAVQDRSTVKAGRFVFRCDGRFLFVDLPSGRALSYYRPGIAPNRWGKPGLTYEGRQPGKSPRVQSHAGMQTENIVQAVARDVLAHGLRLAHGDHHFEVIGHIHDEILCLAHHQLDDAVSRLERYMTAPPWCADAPIKAKGWAGPYYRKD